MVLINKHAEITILTRAMNGPFPHQEAETYSATMGALMETAIRKHVQQGGNALIHKPKDTRILIAAGQTKPTAPTAAPMALVIQLPQLQKLQ